MTPMSSNDLAVVRSASPARGLALMALLVALGMGASSLLYRRLASGLADNAAAARGELPRTPEGRVERWIEFVTPGMHNALHALRLSPERPWIVTHTVGTERNAA